MVGGADKASLKRGGFAAKAVQDPIGGIRAAEGIFSFSQSEMVGGADKASFKRGGLPPKRFKIPSWRLAAKAVQDLIGAFGLGMIL